MVEQTKNENVKYFSTLLHKDTHRRLTDFAKQYSTGLDKWDYGVAIQILLDFYEQNSSITQANMKLDGIMSMVEELRIMQPQPKEEEKEETGIELLGGEVLRK